MITKWSPSKLTSTNVSGGSHPTVDAATILGL